MLFQNLKWLKNGKLPRGHIISSLPEMPKYSDIRSKCFGGPSFQGCSLIRKCTCFDMDTAIVYSVLSSVYSFKISFDDKNHFSPPGSLHLHWQHCELAPVVKEHISWYNDVENHSSFANIITLAVVGQHPTSWSSRNFNWNIVWGPHAAYNFLACVKKDEKKNCVRARVFAFLSHIRFWKGIW